MSKQRIRSIILLAVILVVSVALWMMRSLAQRGGQVCITVDGQLYQTLPLEVDTSVSIETAKGYNIIVIEKGRAFVSEADCANQICVESRSISKNGEVIACIPHGLVVTVTSIQEEVDAVAY
jgi:hypothetical protein